MLSMIQFMLLLMSSHRPIQLTCAIYMNAEPYTEAQLCGILFGALE